MKIAHPSLHACRPKRAIHTPAAAQRGVVTLMAALMLPVLLGTAAFAIDLAWVRVVRNELQNAADAAALAGAHHLNSATPSTGSWSAAEQQARSSVPLNSAAGAPLQQAQVETGYWNPQQVGSQLVLLPHTPTAQEVPAVQVTLRKAEGLNGGPVHTFLARIWSLRGIDTRARSIAGRVAPGRVQPGGVFPLAISQCLYDQYWDRLASPAGPRLDPLTGQPIVFRIGSSYHYGSCDTGQWSSLQTGSNSASQVRDMIRDGSPLALAINDPIWVQSGTETTLYQAVHSCSEAGNRKCAQVVIPVVQSLVPASLTRIQAFACLRLLDANPGGKYVLAQMSTSCTPPQGGGIGPDLGVLLPPRLLG